MANWEHVAKLMEGVAVWNAWRSENPDVQPDLTAANLCWAEMKGADLSCAELKGAVLFKANMKGANLRGADLRFVDMEGADLRGAMLGGANFKGADIREVNLDGAELHDVDLTSVEVFRFTVVRFKADPADLARLLSRIHDWNMWRRTHPNYVPQLEGADLGGADLAGADLSGAKLVRANLSNAKLGKANLSRANLEQANMSGCDANEANFAWAQMSKVNLSGANLRKAWLGHAQLDRANMIRVSASGATMMSAFMDVAELAFADLTGASLVSAQLSSAHLCSANLTGAQLEFSSLVMADLRKANLSKASVYGLSAWDVEMEGAIQSNLLVTRADQTPLHVDDLEMAQFIHMLMSREKLRNMITTMGEKSVLILGRFTERKELLDRMADKLREMGYLPMIFDFERPTDRDLTETVKILAGLSRFVIADITNPRSVPLELMATVPDYMVPFVTILEEGQPDFAMFYDLPKKYPWALKLLPYKDANHLMKMFEKRVVGRALKKVIQVRRQKAGGRMRRSL